MRLCFRIIFLTVVLNFSCFFTSAQVINLQSNHPYKKVFIETDNFNASYLDTLEAYWNKLPSDSLQFSTLNDLAYYWHTRNLTKALRFTELGLKLSAQKNNSLWNGRFQVTQGAVLLRMEKLDSAFQVLQEAKTKVKTADLPFLYTQLGYVFERRGVLDTAADYALFGLELGKKLNDKKAMALAYSDLSNLFYKQSKFEKGLEYGLTSLKFFEERNIDDLDYDFTLFVVGNNYLSLKKYPEALQYYKHSIQMAERYGFYNNLSDVYIALSELYSYQGKFKEAEEAATQAIYYATLLDNNFMLMRSWLSVGKIQNLQGKYDLAIESLLRCLEIATSQFGDKFFLTETYQALGKAYAGSQNYKEAYAAFEKYDQCKNAVFTAEADQRISLLQTEFEVAKKESTISQQEKEIELQRSRQLYVIITAGLLLLLLALLFRTLYYNRKKNKLLQQQNKDKEFLLKEIHHRVKNNLEIVSSLLALQSSQVSDPNVAEAMQESQNRVHSMSMIHQRLYQGKNLASIDMNDYFISLSQHVLDSFGADQRITLEYAVENMELDVDTAVPLGLIVNELLTNALKYAFPGNRSGKIKIGLRQMENENSIALEVVDDGVGQQENQVTRGTGFGTQLISLLTQQLDGKIENNFKKGTAVYFEFRLNGAA